MTANYSLAQNSIMRKLVEEAAEKQEGEGKSTIVG
jgi:hypothetical protein